MKKVYDDIERHENFKSLSQSTLIAYGAARFQSPFVTRPKILRMNNQWARSLWKHLYWDEPLLY